MLEGPACVFLNVVKVMLLLQKTWQLFVRDHLFAYASYAKEIVNGLATTEQRRRAHE